MTSSSFSIEELCRSAESLRALACDLLDDPSLADDAVQKAALTALTRPTAPRASVLAWLRAVVKTSALDLRRAEQRRRLREQRVAQTVAIDSSDGPVDIAERLELQQDILAAVCALAEPYRTTVFLRYYEHLMPAQIAARIGQPVATVKMRLWRALQLLRLRLDGRYGRKAWLATLAPLARGPVVTTTGIGAALAAGALLMQGKKIVVAALALLLILIGVKLTLTSGSVEPTAPGTPPVLAIGDPPPAASGSSPATRQERDLVSGPPATAEATSPYGDLAVHVRWHDGTTAPGVAIVCRAEGEPQLDRNETRVVSDQDGIARAARLHAGEVQLTSDRGGQAKAQVEAGGASTAEFVLPRGIDVNGTVTDDRQRPVAGARIFVASGRTGWLGGQSVASSAADGSFTARSIEARWSIGALGQGHAPSDLVDLESIERPTDAMAVQVQLRLLRLGAIVAGRVTDDLGKPVPGAFVAIGRSRPRDWQAGGKGREFWSPDVTTSDENGDFRCDGVEPGNQPIEVRAAGHGIWSNEIECVSGTTKTIAVTLPRGVTVRGIARNAAGEVVVGAEIAALATPSDWQFLGGGLAWNRSFPWPETRSDAAGCFELQGVLAGNVHLFACKRSKQGHAHEGMCRETLTATAGDTVTWNPVLQPGKRIRLRVLDADGVPGRLMVTATPERPAPGADLLFGYLVDDTFGSFVVSDCADVPYTVAAEVRRHGRTVHAWQSGVLPDGPEIVLRLPPPSPKGDAIVRGRVVDSGRRVPAGKQVMVALAGNGTERPGSCSDDRFEFNGVEAGRYVLLLRVDDAGVLASPSFEVQLGQLLDIGDLVTEPAASITVTLQAPPGLDLGKVRGTLGHGPASRLLTWDGRKLHADNVSAGRHRLMFWSQGWLAQPRDVELTAGQDNEIAVEVIAAEPRTLEILFPFPDRWRIGALRVRDQNGVVVSEYVGMLAGAVGVLPLSWTPSLPAGRFTLEAETDGRVASRWPLDCTAPASSGKLRFSMR